jgi:acetyl-CoA synthetase
MRLSVPKAFITLTASASADALTARSILEFVSGRVSPFKRIRRLEFAELPKTLSGKIRRAELRQTEGARSPDTARNKDEYWEDDFSDLP